MRNLTVGAMVATLLVVLGAFGVPRTTAQEKKPEAKEVTVTGEIVDTVCFLKSGARGEKHKGCAESCAKAGIGLSVYDEKADKIYVVMGRGANDKLLPFVAQTAKVTGKLLERNGQSVIELASVAAAQ